MNNKISDSLTQILSLEKNYFKDQDDLKKYNEAIISYKDLIAKGLIKPNVNKLVDIEDRFKVNVVYNTSSEST